MLTNNLNKHIALHILLFFLFWDKNYRKSSDSPFIHSVVMCYLVILTFRLSISRNPQSNPATVNLLFLIEFKINLIFLLNNCMLVRNRCEYNPLLKCHSPNKEVLPVNGYYIWNGFLRCFGRKYKGSLIGLNESRTKEQNAPLCQFYIKKH